MRVPEWFDRELREATRISLLNAVERYLPQFPAILAASGAKGRADCTTQAKYRFLVEGGVPMAARMFPARRKCQFES